MHSGCLLLQCVVPPASLLPLSPRKLLELDEEVIPLSAGRFCRACPGACLHASREGNCGSRLAGSSCGRKSVCWSCVRACGLASCHAQNVCRVYLRRLPYVSLACCRRSAIFSIWLKNWWPDLFCIVHRVTLLASSQVKDTDKPVAGHSPAHAVRALRREASG